MAGSIVGSSTRLGASWTITTAPGGDVLAVLSIFVALTCMGGMETSGVEEAFPCLRLIESR